MTTKIPNNVVEEIREANDVVEVVGEYVQLIRRGKNHFGLCPFHEEKTPSFSVVKDKQIFHCFGCGKGGNVFTFIEEIENITFVEAVQFLAKRVNYSLPDIQTHKTSYSKEANQLFSAYDWLVKYYHHLLKYSDQGEIALDYIKKRGFSDKTIERFQIGFAPRDSELTIQFLKQKKFPLPFLVKNGLLNTVNQVDYIDPFRGRIIFPIQNHNGKTVAFGGRAIADEQPKYLNSPEHKLFHKGNILYNFSNARGHIRKLNEVVIFEGYLDVIAADQAEIKNAVATLGTALTNEQAKLLKRTVDNVIVCYDGDEAGLQASYEAAQILEECGCEVRVAHLKDGLDPDEYIKKYGQKKFRTEVLDTSDSYIKFIMRFKKRQFNMAVDSERIQYIEEIVVHLAKLKSPIEREYYAKEIANQFQLSNNVIINDIEKYRSKLNKQKKDKSARKSNTNISTNFFSKKLLPAYLRAERALLAHMIQQPYIIEQVQEELGIAFNAVEHQVIVTHIYALYEEKGRIDVSELVDKLDEEGIKNLITELSVSSTSEQLNDEELHDYIQMIKNESTYMARLRSLKQKQKLEKNPIIAAEIGMQIIELTKKMKSL